MGNATCASTKSPSYISLRIILELYLIVALGLAENSQIWATTLVYLARLALYLSPSSLK